MLWILRRTRGGLSTAASLLNALNNNGAAGCAGPGAGNSDSRPARKDYNRLSAGEDKPRPEDGSGLDNETSLQDPDGGNGNHRTNPESDSDSSFADFDFEDREDFSDDSDYEEALTCNVCDRSFACPKQLSSHKQKKRHFGCSACDSLFPSLMALEHHKEEFEHWSGDEDALCSDSEEDDDTVISEECERLL